MAIGGKSKYKGKKPIRGGKKQYSKRLAPLPAGEGGEGGTWEMRDSQEDDGEDDDSDEKREGSKGSDDEDGSSSSSSSSSSEGSSSEEDNAKEGTIKKKPSAKESIVEIDNPNRTKKSAVKASELTDAPREISRKEREEMEKGEAKARYWKLHVQGKTDQAQTDLARLAIVKKQREEAAKQREAEKKIKEEEAKAKLTGKKGQR